MNSIETVFLCVALALPPCPTSTAYRDLEQFVKKNYPDYDFYFVNDNEKAVGNDLMTPTTFKGLRVWLKRVRPYVEPQWLTDLKEEALVEKKLRKSA